MKIRTTRKTAPRSVVSQIAGALAGAWEITAGLMFGLWIWTQLAPRDSKSMVVLFMASSFLLALLLRLGTERWRGLVGLLLGLMGPPVLALAIDFASSGTLIRIFALVILLLPMFVGLRIGGLLPSLQSKMSALDTEPTVRSLPRHRETGNRPIGPAASSHLPTPCSRSAIGARRGPESRIPRARGKVSALPRIAESFDRAVDLGFGVAIGVLFWRSFPTDEGWMAFVCLEALVVVVAVWLGRGGRHRLPTLGLLACLVGAPFIGGSEVLLSYDSTLRLMVVGLFFLPPALGLFLGKWSAARSRGLGAESPTPEPLGNLILDFLKVPFSEAIVEAVFVPAVLDLHVEAAEAVHGNRGKWVLFCIYLRGYCSLAMAVLAQAPFSIFGYLIDELMGTSETDGGSHR